MHYRKLLLACALMTTAGCSATMQSTSGSDYIARYGKTAAIAATESAAEAAGSDVDQDVRRIAAIEPDLRFPARIGLARIDHGGLTNIPGDEAMIWQSVTEELGDTYGEIVPISPLIASMVAEPATHGQNRSAAIMDNVRRGAARQHVDYVVIYEVASTQRDKANVLSVADLTVIGMFVLPSRTVEVEASASALMLDVRTGYPYATLTAHADKAGITRAVSERSTRRSYADTAEERAVAKLADQFADGLEELAARAEHIAKADD